MKQYPFKPNLFLRQARLNLGLSQRDLALRLGVSLKQVWRWEKGVAQPCLHSRQLLCTLFQKTGAELGFHSVNSGFPEPAFTGAPKAAQFRAFLESCEANPVYQREYQTYIQRSQQLNHLHRNVMSFIDWFLAAHPEQALRGNHLDSGFNQPA